MFNRLLLNEPSGSQKGRSMLDSHAGHEYGQETWPAGNRFGRVLRSSVQRDLDSDSGKKGKNNI